MWRMPQVEQSDDFGIANGNSYAAGDFLRLAFGHAGIDWKKHFRVDNRHLPPKEMDDVMGDPSKVAARLAWLPQALSAKLLRLMCDADVDTAERTAGLSANRL